VFIDLEGKVHERMLYREKRNFCVFEYIYFSREDSIILGQNVASERVRIGKKLAETFAASRIEPDIVIDVPNSAYFFASGLAEELGLAYRRGLAKNTHMGRTFILPNQAEREKVVRQKLNPILDVVAGRRIAVVDDSIVRGTTSRHLVRLLRRAGAREVYFVSASPPIRHPCVYGIDMSIRREMIAAHYEVDDIARFIGADRVIYLPLEHLEELHPGKCTACFSGRYPTALSPQLLREIEEERVWSKRD
jgi:amidophosphoribosyltransferase